MIILQQALLEKELPLTVLAAKYCGEYILLISDSQETYVENNNETLNLSVRKLQYLDNPAIGWAFSGPVDVGADFNRWIKNYDWQKSSNWQIFRDDAMSELNKLNKAKRKSMRDAGVKPTPDDVCDVLLAGYITNLPEILVLTSRGQSYFYKDSEWNFTAIGSGENHVRMAQAVLKQFFHFYREGQDLPSDLFRFVVFTGVQMAPKCALPLQMAKITQNGVEFKDSAVK